MRLYFLKNEQSLTADERTHFFLLNKKIFHRMCELADYGSYDNDDILNIHDSQPNEGIFNVFFSCGLFRDNIVCLQ